MIDLRTLSHKYYPSKKLKCKVLHNGVWIDNKEYLKLIKPDNQL